MSLAHFAGRRTAPIRGWVVVGTRPGSNRANEWRSPHNARVTVRHCGHPTANRPYFLLVDGQPERRGRTFCQLIEAQLAAELLELPPRVGPLVLTAPEPPRRGEPAGQGRLSL